MRRFVAAFIAVFAFAAPAFAACDLTPIIGARADARPGDAVMITLEIRNPGDANCPGTREIASGYMVDIFLSTDRTAPSTWAVYAPTWSEDVLLRGGRVSNTQSVPAGSSFRYGAPRYEIGPFILPTGMPPGAYYLCAGVDLGNRVAESNERNNTACNNMRILPPRLDLRRAPTPNPQ